MKAAGQGDGLTWPPGFDLRQHRKLLADNGLVRQIEFIEINKSFDPAEAARRLRALRWPDGRTIWPEATTTQPVRRTG